MIRVGAILGNVHRGYVAPPGAPQDELRLTGWDAQKRRLRKRTRNGRDVAVALDVPGGLADGDVLYAGEDATVVVRVEGGEVVVFRLDPAPSPADLAANALRLGHVLGNQHWPVRLHQEDGTGAIELVVPLALDRRVVDAVVRAHRLEGVSYAFRRARPGEAAGPAPLPPALHSDDLAYGHAHLHNHPHGEEAGGAVQHQHHR